MIGLSFGAHPLMLKKWSFKCLTILSLVDRPYTIAGNSLTVTDSKKDLKVPASSNLTWRLNVSIVVVKANRMLGFLRRLCASHDLGPDSTRLLYLIFVRALLGYASEVNPAPLILKLSNLFCNAQQDLSLIAVSMSIIDPATSLRLYP